MPDIDSHTIHSTIPDALHLNPRRISYILGIIHHQPSTKIQTQHHHLSLARDRSNLQPKAEKKECSLPSISLNKNVREMRGERDNQKSMKTVSASKQSAMQNFSRNNAQLINRQNKTIQLQQVSKINQYRKNRSLTFEHPNYEYSILKHRHHKQEQLLNDYMVSAFNKNNSQNINSTHIYRSEIEGLVAQLTPIDDLETAEKKMKRLKRRNKHLISFDKDYYVKLNQQDMLQLP